MATNNIGAPFSLMTDQPSIPKISRATWVGLFLSLFAMVVIRYAFVFFMPEITFTSAILKETLIWASAAALLVIIRRGEGLSFRSIGLGTCRSWKSIAWGFLIAVVSAAVVGGPGLSHRLRLRAGICSVRETAAVVNYTHRYPRRSSGRIILPRLCDRAVADDWSRTVLVGNDSTGYFFAWPLVRRRGKYSDRAYSGYNLNGILFVAL